MFKSFIAMLKSSTTGILTVIAFCTLFFYVTAKHEEFDRDREKDKLEFDRNLNEFEANFPLNDPINKQIHEQRALEADAKLKEIEKKEQEERGAREKLEEEFLRELKSEERR